MTQLKWSSLMKSVGTATAVLVLVAGSALAQQREEDTGKTRLEQQTQKSKTTKTTRDAAEDTRTLGSQSFQREGGLPEAYQQLDLDQEQKTKIQQALTRHNSQLQQTWNRFHQVHMQTVALEAAWVAALESQMTEEQQDQFREARRNQASGESTRGYRPPTEGTRRTDEADRSDRSDRTEKSDRNPAAADSRRRTDDETAADSQTRNKKLTGAKSDRTAGSQQGRGEDVTTYGIVIFAPEKFLDRKQMSPDKQEQCDRICSAYRQQIMSNWKQLHQLHGQLVQAEAKKFETIDEVLTERQMEQLKSHRSQPKFETSTRNSRTDEGFGAEQDRNSDTPLKPRISDDN